LLCLVLSICGRIRLNHFQLIVPLKQCQRGTLVPNWREYENEQRSLQFQWACKDKIYSSNRQITVAVLYYDNRYALVRHLNAWNSIPEDMKDKLEFLIVDDCSPQFPAMEIAKPYRKKMRITIARIKLDKSWNIGGARNLTMISAPTEIVFLSDIDITFSTPFLRSLLDLSRHVQERLKTANRHLVFSKFQRIYETMPTKRKPHPAVTLISKTAYWNAGGCDEDFVGNYGYTDPHFYWRLQRTPHVEIVSTYEDFPGIEPLTQMRDVNSENVLKRDLKENFALFKTKKAHQNWSNSYIRYDWQFE